MRSYNLSWRNARRHKFAWRGPYVGAKQWIFCLFIQQKSTNDFGHSLINLHMSRLMTKPTKWHVRPAKTQISLGIRPVCQSLRCPHEESVGPLLPIKQTANILIRLGGCPGWSASSLSAQSFCLFCHVAAQISVEVTVLSVDKWWK